MSSVITEQSSLYMEHVNHHHLCSTMINEAHIYWCLVTKLFLKHKILYALYLVLFCFCFLFFVFVFVFIFFVFLFYIYIYFFLVRLRIMKLLHLLKAKRTHDFRWKKPNEDKSQSYNNITVDFEHSLAY